MTLSPPLQVILVVYGTITKTFVVGVMRPIYLDMELHDPRFLLLKSNGKPVKFDENTR